MELIKEKDQYLEEIMTGNEKIYISEDIIVPDTKPDVLKVLEVNAYSGISDKGITNNAFYLEGKVYVNILYIPDNDDEGINSIKTAFDLKERFENPNITPDMKLKVNCDVSRIEFNVLNSRKLSIKAYVNCNYSIIGKEEIEFPQVFDGECGECITKTIMTERISSVEDCDFIIRDSFEIPSGKESACEILKTDFKITDKEIKAVSGKLIAKGILNVCVLYLAQDNRVDFCESEFPFTEVFDVYDLLDTDNCLLDLNIFDITTELSNDNDGDKRIINIEALINASLLAYRKKEINFITDCYQIGAKTSISYEDIKIKQFVDEISTQSSIKEIITPDDKLPKLIKMYNVIAEPEVTKVSTQNERVTIEGRIKAYILYLTDNPKCPVYSFKKDIPFDFSHDCVNSKQGLEYSYNVTAKHVGFSLTSGGEIELRCILSQEIKLYDSQNFNLITDINTNPIDSESNIIIYFVKDGDTLWNIAKNYSVRIDDIKAINSLEDDLIIKGQKLLIPTYN